MTKGDTIVVLSPVFSVYLASVLVKGTLVTAPETPWVSITSLDKGTIPSFRHELVAPVSIRKLYGRLLMSTVMVSSSSDRRVTDSTGHEMLYLYSRLIGLGSNCGHVSVTYSPWSGGGTGFVFGFLFVVPVCYFLKTLYYLIYSFCARMAIPL